MTVKSLKRRACVIYAASEKRFGRDVDAQEYINELRAEWKERDR